MPRARTLIYQEASGQVPLLRWLDELSDEAKEVCQAKVELLGQWGHDLRMPHAKLLPEGIFELRTRRGRLRFRILYCFIGKNVALLSHGFVKKTKRTPASEISKAIRNRKFYLTDPDKYTYKESGDEK